MRVLLLDPESEVFNDRERKEEETSMTQGDTHEHENG